jgi:predicted PurR-regulated permease PerM
MTNRRHIDQFESAVMWGGLALLVYLVYLIVTPFLVPLGWATVLAVVAYPTHERLAIRWGHSRAAAISTLAVTVILIFPSVVLVVAFAREALQIGETLQQALAEGRVAWVERALSEFGQRVPFASNIDLSALATDTVRNSATFLVTRSGAALRNTAGFFLDLVIALFSTFFLLRDAPAIMKAIRRLLPMEEAEREELITRTRNIISAVVTSSGLVAATQGLLGGIAFAIVGIEAPVFWGVLIAFFCLLPLGAAIIWLPASILLAMNGSTTRALILAGLGAGVVSMVDNVLRPILLSGQAKMNGLVILISLLGGIGVFGVLGLVLGPVLVVTALSFLNTYINSPSGRT